MDDKQHSLFCYIIFGVLLAVLGKLLLTPRPAPYLGVYQLPGPFFYVKKWIFFILYKLRQKQNQRQKNVSGQNAGYGMRSKNSVEEMDTVQELNPAYPKAVDAVYFNAANQEGCYFVAATARRQNDLIQTLLYLRVPELGLLQLDSLPDTSLKASKPNAFAAGGLHIQPVTPMKEWKLSFDGKMKLIKPDGSEEMLNVKFDLKWTGDSKLFDFDTDMNVNALCESMAREKWSKDFFNNLRDAHQTHYEQFGTISGTAHIEKYGDKEVCGRGVRDHSYGNFRDWKDIHRYAIQYCVLKDGTAICVGNICFPKTMSRLIIGYVFHPDGHLETVSSTDLELWKFGEDGKDPDEVSFNFKAGGKEYHLVVNVVDRPVCFFGADARIHERLCKFTVNSIPGWGISEWNYRIYPKIEDKKQS